MSEYLLEPKEIDRFMIYCQHQSDAAKGMIKVMEDNNMLEAIIKLEKARAFAYGFVADELRKTESMSIDPNTKEPESLK